MAIKFSLLRPDDLLNLQIEGENLRLDSSQADDPALVPEDPEKPAYLVVTFPPQTVIEQAYFESSPVDPPPDEASDPLNTDLPPVSPDPAVPVAARIGGRSRLVLRIPASEDVRIPYTTAGLLDWEGFELVVSPLAALSPEPTAQQRQDAPGISEPGRLETAIELPYRLILSPNEAVAWQHAMGLKTLRGITEMWHTRLMHKDTDGELAEVTRLQPAPLRAIWSPDYNPDKFEATDPPQLGDPDADWGVLTPMTPSDRHEIVILTSAFHGFVKDTDDFTAYVPRPVLAEKLMLSPLGGWLRSRGEWDPPAYFRPFRIFIPPDRKSWELYVDELTKLPLDRLPRPRPEPGPRDRPGGRGANERMGLTASEGSSPDDLVTDGDLLAAQIDYGKLSGILWPGLIGETGALLSVSEWSHIATQGRDHFVRIVYEGHLYPFGHRASLIKITERKIRDKPGLNGVSTPLAYLVQRMFIVVRQPLRDYTEASVKAQLQYGGRGLPFKNIRLTTLVTPDIADPKGPAAVPGSIYSFWVRLGSGAGPEDDFKFHAVAEDIAGRQVDMTTSLIFVPFGEGDRQVIADYYNGSGEDRAVEVPGQKVTYAPAGGGSAENTALDTTALYFSTHPAPVNKKFGGFLPKLFKSNVNLPAVEALLGKSAGTEIAYFESYLDGDPGNTTGLFAHVVEEATSGVLSPAQLLSEFRADQAGGFATPDLSISGLTSQFGPMAGDLGKIAADDFTPNDFFSAVKDSALLFGTFSLADLLQPLTITAGAPKVQFKQEDLGATPPAVKIKLVTTLDWVPDVGTINLGIVTFHPDRDNKDAELEVHGRIEKIVELPAPPNPDLGYAVMEGSLTDFRVELLHIVEVLFGRFAFKSETGKKLDVTVELDPDTPVRFLGDLQFVEELRKSIPPDLFGDGPSLDINFERVKAGFSIGLPPVSVGVFSLREVVLGAFLELPFVAGLPLFDFSFSSREHPFNLTVSLFGGGGFFHLQLDTLGLKMLEAALEFGASASIDLGVASGGVHIMAGIYFSVQRQTIEGNEVDAATLAGYLRMGGELSVLGLISVSLEFYLIFAYEIQKNAAYGRATLTVKVEVLFFSASVEITVEKRFGGSGGDPLFLETFETPAVWKEYAGAFA